jgi:ABC-2 type transport system permease protein
VNRTAALFRAAGVIARRDYVATVWSRSFLMFLLGPVIALGFGVLLGGIGGRVDEAALRPVVAVVAEADAAAPIRAAHGRLAERSDSFPEIVILAPSGTPEAQARKLLAQAGRASSVVLTGWPEAPRLHGPRGQIERLKPRLATLLDEAALDAQLARSGTARPKIAIAEALIDPPGGGTSANRHILARGAQTVLFMLTILLAGMLLSNLVEEKSNKVIEVLAAAVPVDAIFLGKLVAMLGVSVTGIVIWGTMLGGTLLAVVGVGAIPTPPMGWVLFGLLGILYYVTNYMILGGLFLGIGSQAASVREVQTLSMPVTMAQLAIFALGSAVVNSLDSPLGIFAAIFPLSSPLVMLGRAAQESGLWLHLLALAWQVLWVVLIVRFAARRFRTGVLKSGAPPKDKRRFWRPIAIGPQAPE